MKTNRRTYRGRWIAVTAVLLLVGTGAARAQLQTGNLYGKVTDQTGAALPGVTVTLDTGEAPQVETTNVQGEFRFLSLAPATYKIKAELQGFSPVEYPKIVINVGRNTSIEMTMSSAVEDVITVTSESPLLDEKAIRTGNTVSQNELQKIPTARDPWTVLQSTPGVLVDRANVGGNYSGQQSFYTGPGSFSTQSVWSVDGVVITDMSALGGTPAYFDFDSFEEMQISTGGSDVSIATGGVALNLVTKRGTNEYRGSARFLQVPGSTQSATSFSVNDVPAAQRSSFFGGSNKINKVEDYGAEIGGPILKDHLWLWGSYGDDKVSVQTLPTAASPNGQTDKTDLPSWNVKLNTQITSSNSATLVGFNNAKVKTGRDAGPSRAPETTWDQGQFGGKPSLLKAEDTQIFSPNLYLTVLYSHVYGGFFLLPQSGTGNDVPAAFFDETNGEWHNSYFGERIKRPQTQEKADSSTFFNTGNVSNELKYGAAYRVATAVTTANFQGGGLIQGTPGAASNFLALSRSSHPGVDMKYTSAYVQDTVTTGSLTANLGLRYDRQGGDTLTESVPANFLEPTLLPAQSANGGPIGFTWANWAPRVGLTYALGKDRSTLLRASYSRFADQLGAAIAVARDPLGSPSYYYATTTNPGNGMLTPGQIVLGSGSFSSNAAPNGQLSTPNLIAHGFSAPLTDEILLSAEHALLPEFVVGLNLTYRMQHNLIQEDLLVFDANDPEVPGSFGRVATRADFVPVTSTAALPNGQVVPVTYYVLAPGITTTHGYLYHNGDYQTTYKGASVTFNKRLANRWMMRGNFTYQDWYYNQAGNRPDPTLIIGGGTSDGNYVSQGSQVVQGSGPASGNFSNVYINSKWSFALNGMYQVAPDRPWGFNVAGNLTGRQGYPDPYFFETPSSQDGHVSVINPGFATGESVQIGAADSNRLDNIIDFDLRVEKEFTFQDFSLTLGVDCFNLFNESFVLQRQGQFNSQNGGVPNAANTLVPVNASFVNEVLSPRVYRFGARLSFK